MGSVSRHAGDDAAVAAALGGGAGLHGASAGPASSPRRAVHRPCSEQARVQQQQQHQRLPPDALLRSTHGCRPTAHSHPPTHPPHAACSPCRWTASSVCWPGTAWPPASTAPRCTRCSARSATRASPPHGGPRRTTRSLWRLPKSAFATFRGRWAGWAGPSAGGGVGGGDLHPPERRTPTDLACKATRMPHAPPTHPPTHPTRSCWTLTPVPPSSTSLSTSTHCCWC